MTTAALEPRVGRRCHNPLNSLHAALGPVGPGAVTAAFYNYKHELVAEHVPAVWRLSLIHI